MLAMEPVFAVTALKHQLGHCFMAFLAVTVNVEVGQIVLILRVYFFLATLILLGYLCINFAKARHLRVSAVTSEVQFVVQLVDLVAVVAVDRACQTNPVWLHNLA